MITKRKNISKRSVSLKILYITIFVMLNVVGASYGYWVDHLNVSAKVSTGHSDLIFKEPRVTDNCPDKDLTELKIQEKDKKLHIQIHDAYVGYISTVTVKVWNNGSVPTVFALDYKTNQDVDLEINGLQCTEKPGGIRSYSSTVNPQSYAEVTIVIKTKDKKNYNLLIDLESIGWGKPNVNIEESISN